MATSVSNPGFPEPETRFYGVFYYLKPGYFENPGRAVAFKY